MLTLNVVRWMNYIELAGPIQWVVSGDGNVQPSLRHSLPSTSPTPHHLQLTRVLLCMLRNITHTYTQVYSLPMKSCRVYTNMLPVPSPCLQGTSIPNHCSYPGVSGVKGKGELTPPHVYTEDAYIVKFCSTQVSSPCSV